MTVKSAIIAALQANSAVTTIFTGGIYALEDTGRNGLSPDSVPAAYDADKFLKPTALVQDRSETPWGGGHDPGAQWKTLRNVVSIFLYDDGDRTYANISNGGDAIEAVLDDRMIVGAGALKTINRLDELQDPDLNNALLIQLDFQVVRTRSLQ